MSTHSGPGSAEALQRSWAEKRVLIAGGLGFIGSNLAHQLIEAGAVVSLIDCLRPEYGGNGFNIEGIRAGGMGKVAAPREFGPVGARGRAPEFLFHLAGQTSPLSSMRASWTDMGMNWRA